METPPDLLPCPVCGGNAPPLDAVDFNKSCEEGRGKFLPRSGIPVRYHLCQDCGFCFAPEFRRWSHRDFAERIYNAGYGKVDPDYAEIRPKTNAALIEKLFGKSRDSIRHLDYGGGAGVLSRTLNLSGWQSASYDPFTVPADPVASGPFDLITAFEVFEHVADAPRLVQELAGLMANDGLLFFSTLVSDGEIAPNRKLSWWYAAPRNGHISLFSSRSLELALGARGLLLGSLSPIYHVGFREMPGWASHLMSLG